MPSNPEIDEENDFPMTTDEDFDLIDERLANRDFKEEMVILKSKFKYILHLNFILILLVAETLPGRWSRLQENGVQRDMPCHREETCGKIYF